MIATSPLQLPRTLGETLVTEATAAGRAEICGFVAAGPRDLARYAVTNRAVRAADRFDMDAADQIAAFKRMRATQAQLIAIYHSHPIGEARPSIHDIRGHSYPVAVALIIAPTAMRDAPVRAWRMTGNEPLELALEWTDARWNDGFL